MKKILVILVLAVSVFTACEGPMGPPGEDAEPTKWYIVNVTINQNDWKLVGGADNIGSYYQYVVDVPELTTDIFNDGAVLVTYYYRDDQGDDVQEPVPYTYYDILVDENNVERPYAVQISYNLTPGTVAFKLVFSDFYTGEYGPPASCLFKVTMLY